MKFFNKNVKIALTVIAGLVLLYWGINYLKGINLLTPANYYYTEVESSDGLLQAAPITVNGFQVGQVREINYDYEKNKITVMLAMDKNMKVPKARAQSGQGTVPGNRQLHPHGRKARLDGPCDRECHAHGDQHAAQGGLYNE